MSWSARVAAVVIGVGLMLTSVLGAPRARAMDAMVVFGALTVGVEGFILVGGCDDPEQVSAVVLDIRRGSELIHTQTLGVPDREFGTVVRFTPSSAGLHTATMTCLSYAGGVVEQVSSTQYVLADSPFDLTLHEPQGPLPLCPGRPASFGGLPGQPGETIRAALIKGEFSLEEQDDELLQEWLQAGTVGADGRGAVTVVLSSSVPAGTHGVILMGETSGAMRAYRAPVGSPSECGGAPGAPGAGLGLPATGR